MIPEKRIAGKFIRVGCEWPTAETESRLVTKTRGCPERALYPGGGRVVADA
jgi:hypothetical protein